MILTVTLNAAVDVTYRLDRVARHGSNRIETVTERAGGKGVNVARVLAALGHDTAVTGLAGGVTGQALRAELAAAGLRDELVPIGGTTRRTVAVVEDVTGDATVYLEPGPTVTTEEWSDFTVRYRRLLRTARAVVLSGSLPLGVPPDAYGRLVALATEAGVPAVLDAEGPALLAGLGAGPALVKPNAAELAAAAGPVAPLTGARMLRTAGARAVVVSLGPGGLLASTPEGDWRARPPEAARGNPTGAGDSAVAALTAGLVAGTPWPERLAEAVALSAATVLAPLAGSFDPADHRRLRPLVRVEPVHPSSSTSTSCGPQGEPCPS
ncbi:1-phosphofructokinase family hexose kinase [Streptomyces sp. 1331.2]|uniref:1-phosphofructokinase family hexose kinase n=1 Tax=Streptomyces sp. 1331.2 TaxID=1938835 RepID=UPI000BC829CA|nr:1-phosphofructokinase family hexose kinase [Streptomyces sp. 1331.2]SOB79535.1 tagatose 6-phosphate kinase [Streptomyces sp. 1331.2]